MDGSYAVNKLISFCVPVSAILIANYIDAIVVEHLFGETRLAKGEFTRLLTLDRNNVLCIKTRSLLKRTVNCPLIPIHGPH